MVSSSRRDLRRLLLNNDSLNRVTIGDDHEALEDHSQRRVLPKLGVMKLQTLERGPPTRSCESWMRPRPATNAPESSAMNFTGVSVGARVFAQALHHESELVLKSKARSR